eukprot:m.65075 g.65075  ORF g.65075 m.65075 type:complete len:203 (-) comp17939_c0_seq1:243-851(-)
MKPHTPHTHTMDRLDELCLAAALRVRRCNELIALVHAETSRLTPTCDPTPSVRGSNLSGDITVSQNMMSTASITNKSTCLASGGSVTSELDEEVCVTRTTEAIPLVSIPLQHTSSPSFPDTSIISSTIANTITGSTHSIYTQVPRQMSRRSGMIARSRRKLPTLPHVLTLHTGHSQQEAVQLPNAAIGVQPRGIGLERITNV